ncbi:unnamed protein product [Phytophthora fragariaefolia]|uniref:Unnamed protein product n=1 Tax=Phytophthora fragariaefolia TaxID=1490495 RepID=A0A9W7CID2_9STRA|nr:unnamed protein product [Phytophthora fragariaefolia]
MLVTNPFNDYAFRHFPPTPTACNLEFVSWSGPIDGFASGSRRVSPLPVAAATGSGIVRSTEGRGPRYFASRQPKRDSVDMLGRIALRKAALRSSKLASAQTLRPMGLHTSGVVRKQEEAVEEIPVPTEGLLDQAGLTDWKISAPIIGALAIPAISNHVRLGFDSLGAATRRLMSSTLETHKAMLNIHEDIAAVAEAHKEAVALMCEVQAYKLRHKTRDTFVKNLESIREIEASYNLELQKSMVANATTNVRAVVQKGDKKLKDAAFKHALDILGNATVDENKEDDVAALFTKELRAYAADLEAKQGQVVKLSEAEQSELQADLDAYMKRFGLEDADFKAPKEVKLELIERHGPEEEIHQEDPDPQEAGGLHRVQVPLLLARRGRRVQNVRVVSPPLRLVCACGLTDVSCAGTASATSATCPAACALRASRPPYTVRALEGFWGGLRGTGLIVAMPWCADLSAPIDVYTDWIDECEALNA